MDNHNCACPRTIAYGQLHMIPHVIAFTSHQQGSHCHRICWCCATNAPGPFLIRTATGGDGPYIASEIVEMVNNGHLEPHKVWILVRKSRFVSTKLSANTSAKALMSVTHRDKRDAAPATTAPEAGNEVAVPVENVGLWRRKAPSCRHLDYPCVYHHRFLTDCL